MRLPLLLLLSVFLSSHFASAQNYKKEVVISDSLFQVYKQLNDAETRLMEFKDSDEILRAKLVQLEQINRSRRKFKRQEVRLDIFTCRVANKMAREAAEHRFTGHWNLAGHKPYHRYGLEGGFDHVGENAYGRWGDGVQGESLAKHQKFMLEGHRAFMKERKPNDGHKQQCIAKEHNFVGLGSAFSGDYYAYYEEFLDRYLEFVEVPQKAKKGEEVTVKVRVPEGQFLYFVSPTFDPPFKAMSRAQINRKNSYPDYGKDTKMEWWSWELTPLRSGQEYTLTFKFKKKGHYYIQMYLDDKEYTKAPRKSSTKGKIQASGIIISVE